MARRSLSKDELKSAKAEFVAVKESYTSMKDSLEKEDEERQFFLHMYRGGGKLDYLSVQGSSSEDFTKFPDKIMKAFRRNDVSKMNLLEKLRKALSRFALSFVPESIESVDKALETKLVLVIQRKCSEIE